VKLGDFGTGVRYSGDAIASFIYVSGKLHTMSEEAIPQSSCGKCWSRGDFAAIAS